MTGKTEKYYINGKLSEVGEHKNNKYYIYNAWDSTGNGSTRNGNGLVYRVNNRGEVIKWFHVKNGLKHGKLFSFDAELKMNYEDLFENGKFIRGKSTDSLGNTFDYIKFFKKHHFKERIFQHLVPISIII